MATGIGLDDAQRMETVVAMLANNARRAPGYWIQLTLSMGIATLGLALDSTAVVIGAMLVSPLMGPILELGMGFAVGSSLLVMRASIRVTLSVVVVVLSAALLTLALPFHEMTREISTRTAPTALDLLVAAFCALTATYTTVRPGADSTAAAAGTAIGIALVPPLCVTGFGLGTFAPSVAGGAALLFTANLSAILVLSVISFLLLGFNQVDALLVERDFVGHLVTRSDRLAYRIHRAIHHVLGSRYGVGMRILIPGAFLALVFLPLRHALTEVTWEVRTRASIRRIVLDESPQAMQTALTVDRDALAIRLLVIGTAVLARTLEDTLTARVTRATGVRPTVSVVAVPDARMLREAAAAETHRDRPVPATPVASLHDRIEAALHADLPPEAGPLLGWEITLANEDTATITLHRLGSPLGSSGTALLSHALTSDLRTFMRVRDVALPAAVLSARPGGERAWLDSVRVLLAQLVQARHGMGCVRGPGAGTQRPSRAQRTILTGLRDTDAARQQRLTMVSAPRWEFRLAAGSCDLRATRPDSLAAP